jgi:hypothetical protein
MRALILVLGLTTLVAACGGEDPPRLGAERQRTAPLWMTELDLPGCEAVYGARAPVGIEPLTHPLDGQLLLIVERGTPTCVTDRSSLFRTAALQGPTPDDDPIPLVRESEEGDQGSQGETDEGETDDDPIPIVRVAHGPVGDDPIPLVRERDLGGAQPAFAPTGQHEDH